MIWREIKVFLLENCGQLAMGCALAPCCLSCRTSNLGCSQVVMKMMRIMENGFSTEESSGIMFCSGMSSGTCNLQVNACGHFEVFLHGKQMKMEIICRNKLLDLQFAVLNGSTIGAAQEAIHNITDQAIP